MLPPLCYLLVMQVILMNELPEKKHFWVLIFIPIILSAERFFSMEMLYWLSSMTGTISMLAIWCSRDVFGVLHKMKGGRERYWLVVMLVLANILGVLVTLRKCATTVFRLKPRSSGDGFQALNSPSTTARCASSTPA